MRVTPESVEVTWSDGTHMSLPNLWLRDNCQCEHCRVTQTAEKKFLVHQVDVNIAPTDASVKDCVLRLDWPDGHSSVFDELFIRNSVSKPKQKYKLWKSEFLPLQADYNKFLKDDSFAVEVLENFISTGAVVLIDMPSVPATLETLHTRLGPVREMVFARIHEVVVDPSGYNVAHTNFALPPHNDFASMNWPPSIQALHMLVNDCKNGETVAVDGWAIAEELRRDHPNLFEVLCNVDVPFRMFSSDTETYASNPIIKVDLFGRIAHVRYSNQLMQPIDPTLSNVGEFYRAYHELSRRLLDSKSRAVFRLESGHCLLVAGHRVLHAREAFEVTGQRHLQDAYFEHDHARNHLTVLKRSLNRA